MKRTRKGFTLVELLIVIAIIGALAATMTLSSTNATASAEAAKIISGLRTMKTAALMFHGENVDDRYTNDVVTKFQGVAGDYLDPTAVDDFTGTNAHYLFVISGDKTKEASEWYVGYGFDEGKEVIQKRIAAQATAYKLYAGTKGTDAAVTEDGDNDNAPKTYAADSGVYPAAVYIRVR